MAAVSELSLGNPVAIGNRCIECCLSWQCQSGAAASADIRLEAHLAASEGDRLGVVHRDLHKHGAAQVAAQWEGCGVKHTRADGCAAGDRQGCDEISVDFSSLNATGLVDFVFLSVHAANVSAFSELASATLQLKGTVHNEAQLATDEMLKNGSHALVFILCRGLDGNSWVALAARRPLTAGDISEDLIQSFAECARKKVACGDVPVSEDLEEEIEALSAAGKFDDAIKKQEMLIQNLVNSDGSPHSTNKAFDVLGDLQQRAAAAASGASSSSSAPAPSIPAQDHLTASNRMMQAQIEPLDNGGYLEVKALNDTGAMSVYISRILNANNWHCDEKDVSELIAKGLPDTCNELLKSLQGQLLNNHTPAPAPPTSTIRQDQAGYVPSASSSEPAATPTNAVPAPVPTPATATTSVPTPTPAPSAQVAEGFDACDPPAIFDPPGGDVAGGSTIKWVADGEAPTDLEINGRPCAALDDGCFVTPLSKVGTGTHVVSATFEDGRCILYPAAFCYWVPGQLLEVTPGRGPLAGGCRISIRTSDLGASISEVFIGGVASPVKHDAASSSTSAEVVLPAVEAEAVVEVVVRAANGNTARLKDAFVYYPPECFGLTGDRILLSNDNRTAKRTEGVTGGVCMGMLPLRQRQEGRYFEVMLTEWTSSLKTMAIGVAVKQDVDRCVRRDRICLEEARDFHRVWLAGYDAKGSQFINDGETLPIKESIWRAAKHLRPDASKTPIRLGALWSEPAGDPSAQPELVIFQDGVERVRLKAGGRLPSRNEDLFAVVDLQGSVTCASIVEGASPPHPVLAAEGES